jgi:hypothetical protein
MTRIAVHDGIERSNVRNDTGDSSDITISRAREFPEPDSSLSTRAPRMMRTRSTKWRDSTMTGFELLNMAAVLSTAVVTRYLRDKLSTDATYKVPDRERVRTKPPERTYAGQATAAKGLQQHPRATGPAHEPASPLLQAESNRPPLPSRRRAF